MIISKEFDYRIRYDVEHDLFHAQNIFNDEYIKPTFIEYVQNLEKENAELKKEVLEVRQHLSLTESEWGIDLYKQIHFKTQLTKAKDILQRLMENQPTPSSMYAEIDLVGCREVNKEAEQFLRETDIDNAIQQTNESLDFDKIADEMEQDLKDSEVEK